MIDISLNIFLGPWISADKVQYSLFVFSSFWSLLRNLDDSYYEWSFTNVIQLCRLLWIHYEWGFYPSSECCDGGRINCLGGWNTYYVLINSWGIRLKLDFRFKWKWLEIYKNLLNLIFKIFFRPLWGFLTKHMSVGTLQIIWCAIFVVSQFLLSIATSYWVFIAGMMCFSLGLAGYSGSV